MNSYIKKFVSFLLYYSGILQLIFKYTLNKKNIRVINYHCTPLIFQENFIKQLKFYKKYFTNINIDDLNKYMTVKDYNLNKSGLIISFDDGLRSNYDYALPILNNYNFTGWFFLPAGIILDNSYTFIKNNSINTNETYIDNRYFINQEELNYLKNYHIVGCHTFSHHRFNKNDKDELLIHEILNSKKFLENITNKTFDIFCWVGGELNTYTNKAYNKIINAGYKYAFTTNNLPIQKNQDSLNLNRTNIESYYSIPEVMFQLSGIMDILYYRKRKKVKNIFEQDVIN